MNDFGLQLRDDDGRPLSVGAIIASMDASEFLRAAEAVRELDQAPGWQFLELIMRADYDKSVYQATEGQLHGIEAYAHSAGFIKGLRKVLAVRDHVLRTAAEVAAHERATTDREES